MENLKRLEVGSLLTPKVSTSSTTNISKIVGMLKDLNVYEVFLEDDGKIEMITTRDILRVSSITTTKASSLAYSVPRLSRKSTIGEAARLMMEYSIRAIPVVEDNRFIGEIQSSSMINALKGNDFSKIKAKNIMTGNPITLYSDDLASKARSLMIRRRIDHLPVLDGKKLSGILTSSHIVFNMFQATETIDRSTTLSEKQKKLEFPVGQVMDSDPLICEPSDNISIVLDEMAKRGITCSTVTLWGEVQGIITYRDYMKLLAEQLKADNIPVSIVGLPENPFEAEMVKSKFRKSVELMRKSVPYIEEARSMIRAFSGSGVERRRYEVNISIITPQRTFSYSEEGWDLPKIFDAISSKMKKRRSQKRSRRVPQSEEV